MREKREVRDMRWTRHTTPSFFHLYSTAAAATSGRFNYKAGFSTAQLSGTVKANRMASSAVDSLAFIT